jgi:hypothetical protein
MRMQASSGKRAFSAESVSRMGFPIPIRRMPIPEVSPAPGYRKLMQASTARAASQKSWAAKCGRRTTPASASHDAAARSSSGEAKLPATSSPICGFSLRMAANVSRIWISRFVSRR